MPDDDDIRGRVEARIGQGQFLANMIQLAARQSDRVHEDFVADLSAIARAVREILDVNALVGRIDYRPGEYWPGLKGRAYAFLDGGVANIELPSAAPVGIRVGSYVVKPGDESPDREDFDIAVALVDDLFSDDGVLFDNDFTDLAKLRDAARMTAETAAGLALARGSKGPLDAILMHGPLVNPAGPYGRLNFPAFGLAACRRMIGDENWAGDADRRNFVRFYLEILDELRRTEVPVAGVVERSIGSEPVVLKAIFAVLKDQGKMTEADSRQLVGDMKAYGLNDSALLDVVLSPGEYTAPVPVSRQGEPNQWPEHWSETIEEYPDALTTYLKPSLASLPFRIEMFESIGDDFEPLVDLVMHTSRLLPTYGFPVGLDIVDKFAKVPAWMSRGVRGQHQIVLLRKAMESGDPSALAFAKRMLAAKGRDWLFRPTA